MRDISEKEWELMLIVEPYLINKGRKRCLMDNAPDDIKKAYKEFMKLVKESDE